MGAPTIEVGVALGVPEPGDFIIGDPTRGVIGSTDYLISTGFTTVTSDTYNVSITRGRWSRLWDTVDAGTGDISLWNHDRNFDPSFLPGPYAGSITPGRGVRVKANGVVIWTGFVDDWDLSYDVSGQSAATLKSTDALGVLGQMEFNAWTSSGLSVDAKLTAICDRAEVAWPSPLREFDDGVEALQSDAVSWGSNVLNYVQLIARSDLGMCFAAADGTLTFRNRNSTVSTPPVVVFTDGGTSPATVSFSGIAATIGSELLFARVGVDREGGINQTATVANMAAWRDQYGPTRSLSIVETLLATDAQSLSLAEFLLSLYDTPRYRVSEIEVNLASMTSEQQDNVLALDLTSVVGVLFTPNGVGGQIAQNVVVQGIRHDISVERHTVTFSLIDAPVPFFRIGDAAYGIIGGPYVLGF